MNAEEALEEFIKKINPEEKLKIIEYIEKIKYEGLERAKKKGISEEKFNQDFNSGIKKYLPKLEKIKKGRIDPKHYFFLTTMSRGFCLQIKNIAELLLNLYADKFINIEGGEELRAITKVFINESEEFEKFIINEIRERCNEID